MSAESFDAVLAEVEEIAQYAAIHYPEADDALHDRIMQAKARLQSAHEAEVAELLADARRYRWLRDYETNWRTADLIVIKDLDGPDWSGTHLDLQDLDATIDAAMKEDGRDAP